MSDTTVGRPGEPNPAAPPLRVLLVDDQEMIREAIGSLLESLFGLKVIKAASADEACAVVASNAADVVLLDKRMPDVDGLEVLRTLRQLAPALPVIMLSSYDDLVDVRNALAQGARGYIIKAASPDELKRAIDIACSGTGVYVHPLVAQQLAQTRRVLLPREALSERELIVLAQLCEGATNEQIADVLSVGVKTIKTQLTSVFRKLGVANRTEAVVHAIRDGIVSLPVDGAPADTATTPGV